MDMKNKGQVTLFIIMAIVIVGAVLVFFLWVKPTYISESAGNLGFENCVEDAIEPAISKLGEKAGFIKPEFTYSYLGEEITYLCYTNEYYKTCKIQQPFLKQYFEEQLKLSIKKQIESCYKGSIGDLKAKGYEVVEGRLNYDVSIEPGVIKVIISAPTSVGSQRFVRFNPYISSSLYEMLMVSTSILQYESQLGDSDIDSLMMLYPNLIIDKLKQGEGTTIYILESKLFKNKFKFASRSLAWPAGYDL